MSAIERSKQNNLDKLLFGFGIRNIGDKAAALLAEHFGTLQALREATVEKISEIDGFGGVMAQSVVEFFAKEGTTDLVHRLADAGLNMQWKGEPKGDKLAGKTLVVTGTLESLSRNEAGNPFRESLSHFLQGLFCSSSGLFLLCRTRGESGAESVSSSFLHSSFEKSAFSFRRFML